MIRSQLMTVLLLCVACIFSATQPSTVIAAHPSTLSAAHPYHVSRAEIQYNAQRGVFEVALCVWPEDLEKAIGKSQQERVDLDNLSEAKRDRLISNYVKGKFIARPQASDSSEIDAESEPADPATILWVGSEISLKQAWLYFEIEVELAAPQWSFENRMFFELNEEQMNQIQIQETASEGRRNPFANKNFSRTLSASQPAAIWDK